MTFIEEQSLGRIRKSVWQLVLPTLMLFIAAGIAGYVTNLTMEVWVKNTWLIVSAVVAVVFWLAPIIGHLSFYIDLTTSRVIVRRGLFGGNSFESSLIDLANVSVAKGRKFVIQQRGAEPIEISGLPRPKKLAATIRSLAHMPLN